jgi:hypothetical protein
VAPSRFFNRLKNVPQSPQRCSSIAYGRYQQCHHSEERADASRNSDCNGFADTLPGLSRLNAKDRIVGDCLDWYGNASLGLQQNHILLSADERRSKPLPVIQPDVELGTDGDSLRETSPYLRCRLRRDALQRDDGDEERCRKKVSVFEHDACLLSEIDANAAAPRQRRKSAA